MTSHDWPKRLAKVSDIYQVAIKNGEGPTLAVEKHFSVSRSTAGAWIGRARAAGLLDGISDRPDHQRAKAVAHALGVDYDLLVDAVKEHAGGDLRIR